MGDRSEEARLATLRDDLAHADREADPELWLTGEELDDIEAVGAEALGLLYGLRAENDSRAINALCDVLEPRLTKILYDKPAA